MVCTSALTCAAEKSSHSSDVFDPLFRLQAFMHEMDVHVTCILCIVIIGGCWCWYTNTLPVWSYPIFVVPLLMFCPWWLIWTLWQWLQSIVTSTWSWTTGQYFWTSHQMMRWLLQQDSDVSFWKVLLHLDSHHNCFFCSTTRGIFSMFPVFRCFPPLIWFRAQTFTTMNLASAHGYVRHR